MKRRKLTAVPLNPKRQQKFLTYLRAAKAAGISEHKRRDILERWGVDNATNYATKMCELKGILGEYLSDRRTAKTNSGLLREIEQDSYNWGFAVEIATHFTIGTNTTCEDVKNMLANSTCIAEFIQALKDNNTRLLDEYWKNNWKKR